MEYKFYNSNTLKSVQVNEDTNLIFELTQANNKKVYLNTLLYSSQYGCPITFSLIQSLESTINVGFGAGAKLDFMYELKSVSSTLIELKHPTGDIEKFINTYTKTNEAGKTVVYFYSTTTSNFIKRIANGSITNFTYHNGSFICEFEYKGITPLSLSKFARNGNTVNGWISVTYDIYGKLQSLFNQASEQEFVEFTYSSNYTQFVVSKKFDKSTKTEINKVLFTYTNGSLNTIKEKMHGKVAPVRYTSFTKTTEGLVIKNEITSRQSIIEHSDFIITSIDDGVDKMNITYNSEHQTTISVNGMWEKYFFDFNNNLQHIENSVGMYKTFQYDNSERRLLLLASDNLSTTPSFNTNDFQDIRGLSIISNNSYSFTCDVDDSLPVLDEVSRVQTCQVEEDQESNFSFRFDRKGKRFDVETIALWYKVISYPTSAPNTDISAYIHFYKSTSASSDTLIKSESVFLNAKIKDIWFCNILSGQAAEDYDYVEVYISPNNHDYEIDFSVQLMSCPLAKIIKYDSLGRAIEMLNGKQIQRYKYNEDNQLISSSNCYISYNEYGNPLILVTANNLVQEFTTDDFGNETFKKVYNRDKTKYIQSTKTYVDNEHLTSENTTSNDNLTYLYDDKKRLVGNAMSGDKSTITYSSADDVNYGKVSKIMHSYSNNTSYVNSDGSEIAYRSDGLINNLKHLNSSSAPDCTYNYEYDQFHRITKVSVGSLPLVEFAYSIANNKKTTTMYINDQVIKYNYDENERLISKTKDSTMLYKYNYSGETTRVTSITDEINGESISFEYDGMLLKKVLSGAYKEEYIVNDEQSKLFTKKYYNNSLISIEKTTDSSLPSKHANIGKLENEILQNEGAGTLTATFVKSKKREKYGTLLYETDLTKDLKGINSSDRVECTLMNPLNEKYSFEGLHYIDFNSNDSPLLYQFTSGRTLSTNYTILFGYKLDSVSSTKPLIQICNNSSLALDRIMLYVVGNYQLKLTLLNSKNSTTTNKSFSVDNAIGTTGFIALNVTCVEKSVTAFNYTVEVFFNGKSVGKIENISLSHLMNSIYLMGNQGGSVNVGKITSVFVKTNGLISSTNIAKYTNTLLNIANIGKIYTKPFNKKIRLSNISLPVICFDNTFNSLDGSIKPYKISFGSSVSSNADYFASDSETNENVLVLKNQTLAYDFNLSTSGIVGVKFKRINGTKTNVLSLNDNRLYIHVGVDEEGDFNVTVNSNTYYPDITLNTSWNNIFVKWEKVISSSSIDQAIYKVTLYVNQASFDLGEHELTGSLTKMIMSVGKPYLNTNYYPACNGFVEKAVGCTTSTSISTLNSLFNNYGTGVYNEFNEFGLKTRKQINTSSSNLIIHTYTYNDSSDGRVLGKLSNETVSLSSILTTYYIYNTDNTISKQRVYNSATGTYKDHTFTYDKKKQLTQYSNGTNTYAYTYDSNGNITQISKNNSVIHTATYTNGILLNTVNGYTISYDSNGYPKTKKSGGVDIERYTWVAGLLESIEYVQQQRKVVFKYAANGLRTTKEEWNGTTLSNITKYYYGADGLLAYETRTKDNIKLEYLYDAEGSLYGVYFNGTPYYYVKDALGTITHLVDANKNIVTEFVYDGAYGVHSTTNESSVSSTHITKVNPFRYKGYYYDVETQLYWVSSRYYSPELCRWISPDSIEYLDPESINGLNLYAYCNNDPVNYYDPTGHSAILIGLIIGAVIGAAVGFGTAAYIDYQDDGQVFNGSVAWYDYLGATVLGGAIGAGIGAGIGYIAPQIGSALSSFAAQQFTFGAGTYLTASGELAMTAGLTITGAQILQGAGILSGITIMASIIGKSGGYTVKKFPNDHDPTHVHIFGDDIADKAHGIRIGLDGNPLPGQGKLPPGARKALKKLWELILKALSK